MTRLAQLRDVTVIARGTEVAALGRVKLAVAVLAASLVSAASADPLWQADIGAGVGLTVGASTAMATPRSLPWSVQGTVAIAVNDEPHVYGFGGFVLESVDRTATGFGGVAGVQLSPHGTPWRLRGGGVWVAAPKTLWGALASAGWCHALKPTTGLCADLGVTEYIAGTDLIKGQSLLEVKAVIGVTFSGP